MNFTKTKEGFIITLFILTLRGRAAVDTICRAHRRGLRSNRGWGPVICPLDKTDDSSVVVPAAEPCVSYSCFIYSPSLASGISELAQLALRGADSFHSMTYVNTSLRIVWWWFCYDYSFYWSIFLIWIAFPENNFMKCRYFNFTQNNFPFLGCLSISEIYLFWWCLVCHVRLNMCHSCCAFVKTW